MKKVRCILMVLSVLLNFGHSIHGHSHELFEERYKIRHEILGQSNISTSIFESNLGTDHLTNYKHVQKFNYAPHISQLGELFQTENAYLAGKQISPVVNFSCLNNYICHIGVFSNKAPPLFA